MSVIQSGILLPHADMAESKNDVAPEWQNAQKALAKLSKEKAETATAKQVSFIELFKISKIILSC